jgi:hypothetical protein
MLGLRQFVDSVAPRALDLSGAGNEFKESSAVVAHESLAGHGLDLLSDGEFTVG